MAYEDFPNKVFVRMEFDTGNQLPDLQATRTAEEHAVTNGDEIVGEYVLNRLLKVRKVITETITVEDEG